MISRPLNPNLSQPPYLDRQATTMSKLWISLCATLAFNSACSNVPEPVNENVGQTTEASENEQTTVAAKAPTTVSEANHQPVSTGAMMGPVLETMDAGGYTYALLQTTAGEIWAAGPTTRLEVGQVIELKDAFPMEGFESAALGRTFETIYFCGSMGRPTQTDIGAADHMETPATATANDNGVLAPAEKGQKVGDLIAKSTDFVGKPVTIRARVVKFSANIMQKNWIHIQDGSGAEGSNDLTVTTAATVAVGDIVLVKGTLIADKDFGYGYKYDLIIEDAEVTVE
jgi:hypothetical protein